jgi:hypothetical protein
MSNKPKFDPSKPFEVIDQKPTKPKFDPSKPFETIEAKPKYEGKSENIGFGSYVGEQIPIAGPLVAKAGIGARALFETVLPMKGQENESVRQKYARLLAEHQGDIEAYEKENPVRSLVGTVLGGAAIPIPGAGMKGLAGAATRIGAGAAIEGADVNVRGGDTTGAAMTAGGVGAGVEALGGFLGKARKVIPGLRRFSEERALKAVTGNYKKQVEEITRKNPEFVGENIENFGKTVLNADEAGPAIVGFARSTPDKIRQAATKKKEYFGQQIGEIRDTIDELVPQNVSTEDIIKQMRAYRASILSSPKNMPLKKRLKAEEKYIADLGDNISLKMAQRLKDDFQWKMTDPTKANLGQDATNKMYNIISKAMEEATDSGVEQLGKSLAKERELVSKYRDAKEKYRAYKLAEQASGNLEMNQLKNRIISPSDYAVGIGGAVGGGVYEGPEGIAKGALLGLGHKIARERGSAISAAATKRIADFLEKNTGKLGKFADILEKAKASGRANLAITHGWLLENNPEYRKLVTDVAGQQ